MPTNVDICLSTNHSDSEFGFFKDLCKRIMNFLQPYATLFQLEVFVGNSAKYKFVVPYNYILSCIENGEDIIWEGTTLSLPHIAPDITSSSIPIIDSIYNIFKITCSFKTYSKNLCV